MFSIHIRLHALIVTTCLFLSVQTVNAAIQLEPVAIDGSDGSRLGYAHVFLPNSTGNNSSATAEPIVYLPGFDINLADLIEDQSTQQSGSQSAALRNIRELVLTQSPNPASQHPQLLESLVDDYGHTLVMLEYADASAGIEHNARAVEAVLTDPQLPVMQHYQSTGTRSFLLGWSMGGMIGRYALTKMEHEGTEHNIAMYVSYDVPHQGANLPLSLEAFVALMRQVLAQTTSAPDLSAFENLLDAAQEKYNSTSGVEMLKPNLNIQPGASVLNALQTRYNAIYNEPQSMAAGNAFYAIRNQLSLMGGYPERLKKIAISNGDGLGSPLPLPTPRNGNELVRLTATVPITSRFNLRVMDIRLYDNANSNARSNCRINYFFNTTQCPPLRMPAELHDLSAGVGSHTNVVARLVSVFENQQALRGEWLNQGYSVNFSGRVAAGEGLTTFIPMHSAFDFNVSEATPASVVSEQTPFDSLYANTGQNMAHNAVSPEIFDALINEIDELRQEQAVTHALPAIY